MEFKLSDEMETTLDQAIAPEVVSVWLNKWVMTNQEIPDNLDQFFNDLPLVTKAKVLLALNFIDLSLEILDFVDEFNLDPLQQFVPELQKARALKLLEEGKFSEALLELEPSLDVFQIDSLAQMILFEAYTNLNQTVNANRAYKALMYKDINTQQQLVNINHILKVLVQNQNFYKAWETYGEALKRSLELPLSQPLATLLVEKLENPDDAIDVAEKFLPAELNRLELQYRSAFISEADYNKQRSNILFEHLKICTIAKDIEALREVLNTYEKDFRILGDYSFFRVVEMFLEGQTNLNLVQIVIEKLNQCELKGRLKERQDLIDILKRVLDSSQFKTIMKQIDSTKQFLQ